MVFTCFYHLFDNGDDSGGQVMELKLMTGGVLPGALMSWGMLDRVGPGWTSKSHSCSQ